MDYDYFDDSRTRFQVQSGNSYSDTSDHEEQRMKKINPIQVGACLSFSVLLLGFAWTTDGFLQFLLVWIALSTLLGPFAPLSATGGLCHVGIGETIPEVDDDSVGSEQVVKNSKNHRKSRNGDSHLQKIPKEDAYRNDENAKNGKECVISDGDDDGNGDGDDSDGDPDGGNGDLDDYLEFWNGEDERSKDVSKKKTNVTDEEDKKSSPQEWSSQDLDMLKKLMIKYPRGKLQRWEVISEAFDGKHSVESIVKMSKSIGERTKGDENSYSQFLTKRKGSAKDIDSPLTQRWEEGDIDSSSLVNNNGVSVKEESMETSDDSPIAKGEKKKERTNKKVVRELPGPSSSR